MAILDHAPGLKVDLVLYVPKPILATTLPESARNTPEMRTWELSKNAQGQVIELVLN